MRRICAWCGKNLKEKWPYDDDSITHTICEECAAREEEDLIKEEEKKKNEKEIEIFHKLLELYFKEVCIDGLKIERESQGGIRIYGWAGVFYGWLEEKGLIKKNKIESVIDKT